MTWLRDNNTHLNKPKQPERHPKCLGEEYDSPSETRDFGCGYESSLDCGECKYGAGRKDPEAKCNQL